MVGDPPQLANSRVRYLADPASWCRMSVLVEKDDVVVTSKITRPCPRKSMHVKTILQRGTWRGDPGPSPRARGPAASSAHPTARCLVKASPPTELTGIVRRCTAGRATGSLPTLEVGLAHIHHVATGGGAMAVRSPRKSGRTRWDLFAEAIQGGWASTARLAVLLILSSTPACGAGLLIFHLIEAYLHHH
jgi:hypothetical protein